MPTLPKATLLNVLDNLHYFLPLFVAHLRENLSECFFIIQYVLCAQNVFVFRNVFVFM